MSGCCDIRGPQPGPCDCLCHAPGCKDRGTVGPHFCVGKNPRDDIRWDLEREIDLRVFEQLDGGPRCKKHRQYRALRRPRTACEACWRRWIALHPA